ncbi:hypothetical protein C8R45DRAFT_934357 [Mycena sanguinolenta]|nr:hypothetical protein C8R45DRAFT_934357 [Mycena sanguinolenta]
MFPINYRVNESFCGRTCSVCAYLGGLKGGSVKNVRSFGLCKSDSRRWPTFFRLGTNANTEWNLSSECLYSKDSAKALQQFLREDTTLATEIANRCGAAHLAKALETPGDEALDEEDGDFDTNDDSDVSLPAVVGDALGIAVDVESSRNAVLSLIWQRTVRQMMA